VERKDASTSFLLVYFCGGRGAQIPEGKIEARDSKTSREKFFFQKTTPKTRHHKSSRRNIQTNRRHWLGVEPERVFFFETFSCCGVAAAVCASLELGELGFLVRGREKREKRERERRRPRNTLGTWGTYWEPD